MARKTRTRAVEFVALAAAAGLFVTAMQLSPTTLTRVQLMLGSAVVGVSASVAPNADNMLAAELARKETELAEREAALGRSGSENSEMVARYSLMASAALFGLLALNYILDWRRSARARRVLAS